VSNRLRRRLGALSSDSYANPCDHDCAPKACTKVDATTDRCSEMFRLYYQQEEECATMEQAQHRSVTFRELPFVLMGIWIIVVTIAALTYTAFNKVYFREELEEGAFLAGFCEHGLGTGIYYAVIVTVGGFQIVFLALVTLYTLIKGRLRRFKPCGKTNVKYYWRLKSCGRLALSGAWSSSGLRICEPSFGSRVRSPKPHMWPCGLL
jgi:hypothetical protein